MSGVATCPMFIAKLKSRDEIAESLQKRCCEQPFADCVNRR